MGLRFWLLTLTPLLALLTYSVLLFLILRLGPLTAVQRRFASYLFVLAVWSLGSFMMRIDPVRILMWNKVLTGAGVTVPLALFAFLQLFVDQRRGVWLGVGLLCLLGIQIANVLGFIVEEAALLDGGLLSIEEDGGAYVAGAYGVFFLVYSIWTLARAYRRARDPVLRNRIRYPLLGALLVLVGGSSNTLPMLSGYPVDHAANLLNAMLLAYVVFRYRLVDVRLVVRKGLLYLVPTAAIGTAYFLFVLLIGRVFHLLLEPQIMLLSVIVAALTAAVAQPLHAGAQHWIDRLFFREKHDASAMLEKLSRWATSVRDLDQLTDSVLHEITTTMHIRTAAFLLKHEKSKYFVLVAQRGFDHYVDLRMRGDHPLVGWLSSHQHALTRQGFEMIPLFKGLWGQERKDLETIGAELFVPLVSGEELIGILVAGPKLSETPYSPDERLTLTTLGNQVAVAIQNAWLYEEVLTEKKRTETIVEETFAGIILVDQEMRILRMNPAAEAITGYSPEELVGRRLPEFLCPDAGCESSPICQAINAGERVSPSEARLAFKNGVCDILLGLVPLGDISVLSFTDITYLKEVDRLKTNIVANVSHELRTPLSSIKAYTELLLDGLGDEDGDARRHFLSTIDQKADKLGNLIGDLLDLSRLESGHFEMHKEPVSVGEIIADAMASVETEMLDRDVRVCLAVPPLPYIIADRQLMVILARNLVSNAIKFSHRGGRVDVVARQEGNHLVLEVIDQGLGIPAEEMSDLFHKFRRLQTAKEAGTEGTGLGLVLVKEAVAAHDGHIEVESSVGEGTRFRVTLPLGPSSQEPDLGHDAYPILRSKAQQG